MRKHSGGKSVCSLIAVLSLIAAPVFRYLSVYYLSYVFAGIYAAIIFAAAAAIAVKTLKIKRYACAFELENPFHLDLFSYMAAAGFFADFVCRCVLIFCSFGSKSNRFTGVFASVMSAVCALISSGYFVMAGLSYSGKNYDFRKFRFVHIFPMFCAVSDMFCLYEFSTGSDLSIDKILMYAAVLCLVCFFYCFAREIYSNTDVKNSTVLFAGLGSYLSVIFFFDRLILVLSRHAPIRCAENAFCVSALLISGFIFSFGRNIIYNYTEKIKNTEN